MPSVLCPFTSAAKHTATAGSSLEKNGPVFLRRNAHAAHPTCRTALQQLHRTHTPPPHHHTHTGSTHAHNRSRVHTHGTARHHTTKRVAVPARKEPGRKTSVHKSSRTHAKARPRAKHNTKHPSTNTRPSGVGSQGTVGAERVASTGSTRRKRKASTFHARANIGGGSAMQASHSDSSEDEEVYVYTTRNENETARSVAATTGTLPLSL